MTPKSALAMGRPDTLVILESKAYPYTTEEVVQRLLERDGLTAGGRLSEAAKAAPAPPVVHARNGIKLPLPHGFRLGASAVMDG